MAQKGKEYFSNNKERSNFAQGAADVSDDGQVNRGGGFQNNPPASDGYKTTTQSVHDYLNNRNNSDTSPGTPDDNKHVGKHVL